MAGLSKTKSDSLPAFNLTRNPKDLPVWATDNAGFIGICRQIIMEVNTLTLVQGFGVHLIRSAVQLMGAIQTLGILF